VTKRRAQLWLGVILCAGMAFRAAVVSTWHVPAGDGIQYYQLSQELIAHHRFAIEPPPADVSIARMPGYPLFLAAIVMQAPLELGRHLIRATAANVIIDALTALLVLAILLRFGEGWRVGLVGVVITLSCPLLLLLCCYGLSEALATMLSTLAVWLALRGMEERLLRNALLAGLVAGVCLLCRGDTATLAAPMGLAFWFADAPLRKRLAAIALTGAVVLVVFSPWLIRNMIQFGAPHPEATYWRDRQGKPLPTTMVEWERTWASSAPGESYFDMAGANGIQLDPTRPGILMPQMYDSDEEKAEVAALFRRYSHERWTPAVVDGFRELARARRARHPFKTYLILPITRMYHLWAPMPEYELPMRVWWLGLPRLRYTFGWIHGVLYLLALVGMGVLWRRGGRARQRMWVLSSWLAARMLMLGYAVPVGVTQRYLVEAFPVLIVCAAVALGALEARLRSSPPAG